MGDPMTYLTVEVAESGCGETVRDAVDEWKASWASTVTAERTIGSQSHGIDVGTARDVLEDVLESVDRALIVTVNGSSRVGTGRFFVSVDDDLLLVDTVTGGENRGVDVVDYVHRRYGLEGVGYRGRS